MAERLVWLSGCQLPALIFVAAFQGHPHSWSSLGLILYHHRHRLAFRWEDGFVCLSCLVDLRVIFASTFEVLEWLDPTGLRERMFFLLSCKTDSCLLLASPGFIANSEHVLYGWRLIGLWCFATCVRIGIRSGWYFGLLQFVDEFDLWGICGVLRFHSYFDWIIQQCLFLLLQSMKILLLAFILRKSRDVGNFHGVSADCVIETPIRHEILKISSLFDTSTSLFALAQTSALVCHRFPFDFPDIVLVLHIRILSITFWKSLERFTFFRSLTQYRWESRISYFLSVNLLIIRVVSEESAEEERPLCLICRDTMSTALQLPCGHHMHAYCEFLFHLSFFFKASFRDCANVWIERHPHCPICFSWFGKLTSLLLVALTSWVSRGLHEVQESVENLDTHILIYFGWIGKFGS